MNARSEFVAPRNFGAAGVFETSRMFQAASAAGTRMMPLRVVSSTPARSPTRGSGFGGDIDMSGVGEPPADDEDVAQAATDSTPIAIDAVISGPLQRMLWSRGDDAILICGFLEGVVEREVRGRRYGLRRGGGTVASIFSMRSISV